MADDEATSVELWEQLDALKDLTGLDQQTCLLLLKGCSFDLQKAADVFLRKKTLQYHIRKGQQLEQQAQAALGLNAADTAAAQSQQTSAEQNEQASAEQREQTTGTQQVLARGRSRGRFVVLSCSFDDLPSQQVSNRAL